MDVHVLNSAARRLGYESLQAAVVHAFVEGNGVFAALLWRAKRNKNQSATLRHLPRNIATWTAQYYQSRYAETSFGVIRMRAAKLTSRVWF